MTDVQIHARMKEIDNMLQQLQAQQQILLGQKSECARFLAALQAPQAPQENPDSSPQLLA